MMLPTGEREAAHFVEELQEVAEEEKGHDPHVHLSVELCPVQRVPCPAYTPLNAVHLNHRHGRWFAWDESALALGDGRRRHHDEVV